jgi:hypothetical protein
VGIFPYVLKLLQSPAVELREILVFIWAKILALDKVTQFNWRAIRHANNMPAVLSIGSDQRRWSTLLHQRPWQHESPCPSTHSSCVYFERYLQQLSPWSTGLFERSNVADLLGATQRARFDVASLGCVRFGQILGELRRGQVGCHQRRCAREAVQFVARSRARSACCCRVRLGNVHWRRSLTGAFICK